MSLLTQLTVPGEARPLKIALEAIYTSSFVFYFIFNKVLAHLIITFRKRFRLGEKN